MVALNGVEVQRKLPCRSLQGQNMPRSHAQQQAIFHENNTLYVSGGNFNSVDTQQAELERVSPV
jgi:hypothetical protein